MTLFNKKNVFLGIVAILALSVPLTISILQQQQETRSKAAASTTLEFTPSTTVGNPLVKQIGDTISLDLMVTPGTNLVTFVKFQLTYDATKLQPITPDPFTRNTVSFQSQDGPVVNAGTLTASVSVGSDVTKAIQQSTKVGTIQFKAISATNGAPTMITFGSASQALSVGNNDQASENVLSTTTPAAILINSSATPSGSITPKPTATGESPLSFKLLLHGIGSAGDNPNPNGSELSNKNPLHPQRNLHVELYDTENNLVTSASGALSLNYDEGDGAFLGSLDLGPGIKDGNYNLKVKTDRYLRKRVASIIQIKNGSETHVPETELVAGDINSDNALNVIDYNALLDCGYGDLSPLPLADPNAVYNTPECQAHNPPELVDLDDNGTINSFDYNLFIRELSVQNGD
jgi:hypothetical protein